MSFIRRHKNPFIVLVILVLATTVYAADTLVRNMTAAASASADDAFYMVDEPNGVAANRKIGFDELQKSITAVGTITTGIWNAGAVTSSGTIAGATLTEGGTGVYNITQSDAAYQPLEATLTDIADGTIAENLVNTANPWATNEITEADPLALLTAGTDNIKDTHPDWGAGAGQIDLADIPGGISGASVWDFGGATTFEIPNAAGNVTLAVIGQAAVDSTQKQLVVHDGVEKAIPLVHSMQFHGDLAGAWDVDAEWQLLDMDRGASVFPAGIVITSWYVDCSVADPTTELNANLYYCDALANGAFPGATPVLVDVLDTTTGNSSETNMALSNLGSGIIPTGKILYILMDTDPVDTLTVWSVIVNFYIPES